MIKVFASFSLNASYLRDFYIWKNILLVSEKSQFEMEFNFRNVEMMRGQGKEVAKVQVSDVRYFGRLDLEAGNG